MRKLCGLCLLLAALSRAVAGEKVTTAYFTDGDELTFNVTRSSPEKITNILWKFNGDLLAEWVMDKVELELYQPFSGRAKLNTETARLVVRNMVKMDTGKYTLGINSKMHGESYEAVWIRMLDKPKVVIRTLTCAVGMKSCNVSCETDTTEARPVAYSWKIGGKEWTVSEKDTIEITTSDNVHDQTIICQISNPVGNEVGEGIVNPLYYNNTGSIVLWVLLGFAVAVAVAVLMWMYKCKKGCFKAENTNRLNSLNTLDPTTYKPAPTTDKSAPTTIIPAPTINIPAPTTNIPAPTTDKPAPTTDKPAPTTDKPAPTTDKPAPTTDISAPTTDISAPTTDISAPTTDISGPTINIPAPTPAVPNGDSSNTRSEEEKLLPDEPKNNKDTVTS